MANAIVIVILLAAVIPAVCYIVRARKKGQRCIGCPNASRCGSSHCDCNCDREE